PFQHQVGAGDHFDHLQSAGVLEIDAADGTASDDADFDRFHCVMVPPGNLYSALLPRGFRCDSMRLHPYLASIQSLPIPASAFSGTLRLMACSIPSTTRAAHSSALSSGASKISSSWIWRRSLSGWPSRSIRSWILTMATLIRSAALPCTTVLIASRSPRARRGRLLERISGIARLLPRMVVT